MTTQAEKVVELVGARCERMSATTFEYNYGVWQHSGERVLFADHGVPVPHKLGERRSREGRCLMARFEYPDGSLLRFTWSERDGSRVSAERHL